MKFFFDFLQIMYFLTILANMCKTFDFAYVECCVGIDNKGREGPPKKN